MYKHAIKPLSYYLDVNTIVRSIQKLDIEEILSYLGQYGIIVWKIDPGIFVALDYETRFRRFHKVSTIQFQRKEDILKLALETIYGVKIYTESDLRNILKGLVIHREYSNALGFLLPCETEVKVIDVDKHIVGIADIVCNDCIIEVKASFRSIPRREHIYQL